MPADQEPRREEQGDEWIKRELKSLRRIPAPWYFEANLRRKLYELRGRRKGMAWIARPLPAYGASAIGVVGLAFVGYLLFLRPETHQGSVPGFDAHPAPALQSRPAPSPEIPLQQNETVPTFRRKADVSRSGAVSPPAGRRENDGVKGVAEPREQSGGNAVRQEQSLSKADSGSPRVGLPERGFAPGAQQKSMLRSAVPDSARARDSLKHQPRKLRGTDSAAVAPPDSVR